MASPRIQFAQWAVPRHFARAEDARAAWDAVAAWMMQAVEVQDATPAARTDALANAISTLLWVRYGNLMRRNPHVQSSQVVAARIGDFTPVEGESAVLWRLRRCGWAVAGEVVLRGADLDALRLCARYGREGPEGPPAPDDPLLASVGGREWTARAVRRLATLADGRGENGTGVPDEDVQGAPDVPDEGAQGARDSRDAGRHSVPAA